MKDFEKDLRTLRDPGIRVNEFKRTLRRDLKVAMQAGGSPLWKPAFAAAALTAVAFAFLLTIFIVDPAVPARLHASAVGGAPSSRVDAPTGAPEGGLPDLQNAGIQYLLNQANASAQVDRAYLEDWYEDRARPVQVKAVEGERLLAIRQFELSNGERVVVLTELGTELPHKDVQTVSASTRNF